MVSWFKPSWQPRSMWPLAHPHPALVGWGGELEEKGKHRSFGKKTVQTKAEK